MNQRDAERIARKLIAEHAPGWTLSWGRGRTQFGLCMYGPKIIRLSLPLTLLNDQAIFEGVVLHEIAHVKAGPNSAGHGPVWRSFARDLGIRPDRCIAGAVEIEGQYLAICPTHGQLAGSRLKMTYATYHRVCRRCRSRITWTRRDGRPVVEPKRPAPRRRKIRGIYA